MSRPLSDQERAALATVQEHVNHAAVSASGWWAECLALDCAWTEYGATSRIPDAVLAHRAHVTEQLAAVVQTIVDEREAGQG